MAAVLENVGDLDGLPVYRARLANVAGMQVGVLSYGATVQFLTVPDGQGGAADLVLGYDRIGDYAVKPGTLGATVGRFANRIAHGRCSVDGRTLELPRNQDGRHHLHGGGPLGFAHKHWQVDLDTATNAARFSLRSPDGDAGYPGTMAVSCIYRLTDDNRLGIRLEAECDAPTPVNLVNHAYWNLAGSGTIDAHELQLDADRYLEVDAEAIPSGRLRDVAGTAFDFRTARPIAGAPLDHCFVVRGAGLRPVARLWDRASGRSLEVHADQPGVQVYAGFMLDTIGRGNAVYGPRTGFCLETETFPDAPNHPDFPDAILRPGQTYRHTMDWRIGF